MPKLKSRDFLTDITFCTQLTIRGGRLKEPMVVATVAHEGATFVEVSKITAWLTKLICGCSPSGNPLKRTTALEKMRDGVEALVEPAPAGGDVDEDDPMAALGLGAGVPPKRQKRDSTPRLLTVMVNAGGGVGGAKAVRVLVQPTAKPTGRTANRLANMRVQVDDLPIVLHALHTQYELHGVPPVDGEPGEESDDNAGKVWYDFRDRAWIVGAWDQAEEKRKLKKFYVPRRDSETKTALTQEEYAAAMRDMRAKAEAYLSRLTAMSSEAARDSE